MKRGSLIPSNIASLVVLILAFGIVMAILLSLDFEDLGNREVCKLSVLTRASTPISVQNFVPLKCNTENICIGGRCENSFSGEKITETIKLPSGVEKQSNRIEETIAQELYECWDTMGQGKLDISWDYFRTRGLDEVEPVCVICSRISLDETIPEETIKNLDIHGYLRDNAVPGKSSSYVQEFTNGKWSQYPSYKTRELDSSLKSSNEIEIKQDNELAIVYMQIKAPDISSALSSLGTDAFLVGSSGAAVSFMGYNSAGKIFSPKILQGAKVGGRALGLAAVAAVVGGAGVSASYAYLSEQVAAGYCGELNSKDSGASGCSMIQVIPYDQDSVNKLCSIIEGGQA